MSIEDEFRSHFNEPVLIYHEINAPLGRVIGYAEDEMDCYLVVSHIRNPHAPDAKPDIRWHTAVGGYIFLKPLDVPEPVGDWTDYKRIDGHLTIAGVPPAEEWISITPAEGG